MKNDDRTNPLVVSVHPNCSFIGIAATEMFVRSMYEMKTAAVQSTTTECHGFQRSRATTAGAGAASATDDPADTSRSDMRHRTRGFRGSETIRVQRFTRELGDERVPRPATGASCRPPQVRSHHDDR